MVPRHAWVFNVRNIRDLRGRVDLGGRFVSLSLLSNRYESLKLSYPLECLQSIPGIFFLPLIVMIENQSGLNEPLDIDFLCQLWSSW